MSRKKKGLFEAALDRRRDVSHGGGDGGGGRWDPKFMGL